MVTAKVQHYVPQFLLRHFGNGKKDQLWVYDKTLDRAFPTNVKNVASESRFYDFEHDGLAVSLEPWLAQLEGQAKSVIASVLAVDSVSTLADEQRQTLASFLAVQLIRTRTFREEWNSFPRMLRERLERNGDQVAPGSQAAELLRESTENESKEQTARLIIDAPRHYAAHLLDKQWVLAATTRRHPFLVSDNPLTRQNMIERPHRGNLGLTTEGIEIYLPLSPTRALALWCPMLVERVHRNAVSAMLDQATEESGVGPDPLGPVALSEAVLSGRPVQYSTENVENFNSLQVAWSERYVFSSVNDFHLAKQMLAASPNLRHGPRSQVM